MRGRAVVWGPLIMVLPLPQTLYSDTYQALHQLLRSALSREPTPDGLQGIFKVRQEGRRDPVTWLRPGWLLCRPLFCSSTHAQSCRPRA